jgi:hypothetical protein
MCIPALLGGFGTVTAPKMPSAQASARLAVLRGDDVHELVRRRSISLYARMRVAEAIRAVAVDICGGDDTLSAADRAWLRQAIASPVNEATEECLRVLVDELSSALRVAPARIPSLVAPLVSRTDFE